MIFNRMTSVTASFGSAVSTVDESQICRSVAETVSDDLVLSTPAFPSRCSGALKQIHNLLRALSDLKSLLLLSATRNFHPPLGLRPAAGRGAAELGDDVGVPSSSDIFRTPALTDDHDLLIQRTTEKMRHNKHNTILSTISRHTKKHSSPLQMMICGVSVDESQRNAML